MDLFARVPVIFPALIFEVLLHAFTPAMGESHAPIDPLFTIDHLQDQNIYIWFL